MGTLRYHDCPEPWPSASGIMKSNATERRRYWVAELARLSGSFVGDTAKMIDELRAEIASDGLDALVEHLSLCGAIPEQYGHDSSEEKLYSKYTDAVVSERFAATGLKSVVIEARADAADVQALGNGYSLVADAKAFRLSRTAKNQKDFKVQAMDGWRGPLDYAIVVCPIYQVPGRTSQIYHQAIVSNVCVLSYTHLSTLVQLSRRQTPQAAEAGLHEMLKSVALMNQSKDALGYWYGINRALVESLGTDHGLWTAEKVASENALLIVKAESLTYLRAERNRILALSHEEALQELVRRSGLDARIKTVEGISHGPLLDN